MAKSGIEYGPFDSQPDHFTIFIIVWLYNTYFKIYCKNILYFIIVKYNKAYNIFNRIIIKIEKICKHNPAKYFKINKYNVIILMFQNFHDIYNSKNML